MTDLQKSECPVAAGQVANQTVQRLYFIKPACFWGTASKRHSQAIQVHWISTQPREAIATRAEFSKGTDLIAELRRRGLDMPCKRTPCIDRDVFDVKRGVCYLAEREQRLIRQWKMGWKGGAA